MTRAPRRQDALSYVADRGFLIASVGGVWYLAAALTKLQIGQDAARKDQEQADKSAKKDQEQANKSLKEELLAAKKDQEEADKSLKEELLAAKKDQEEANKSLKDELLAANKSLKDELLAANKSLKEELLAELRSSTAGVSRAFRSVGAGMRQLGGGGQLTAFAAATPADVTALLQAHNFGQYATALSHLSGAEALLQSEASLRALGVAEGHAQPLLELLKKP